MKLNIDFERLERARASIGADKAEIGEITPPIVINRSPIEIELIEQGSLVLQGVELDKVLHFPAGIAAIGSTQITLHIFQPYAALVDLNQIPAPKPRYHVADCKTLEEMRQRGKFDRYVSTAKADGFFRVKPRDFDTNTWGDEMRSKLAPCQNCLKYLNYDGFEEKKYHDRKMFADNFDIQKFFKNYEPIFRCLPLYTADNFPGGNYTADWASISERVRIQAKWKCKDCGVNLSEHRHLLHAHHKDGNRGNNKPINLEPLCCVCHQMQPFHGKMHIDPKNINLIKELRVSQ